MPPEPGRPGPHPLPLDDLAERPLPLTELPQSWFCIHRSEYAPLHFGRAGGNRFDAPAGEYGVLYVGSDAHCAFIETFGHATGVQFVTMTALQARDLALIAPRRPLRLVDLTGPGLAHLGADERLCTGEYTVAQRWSLALRRHPDRPDGLYYRSRHDPSRTCAALFDHLADALTVLPLGSLAARAQKRRLAEILDTYRFGLLDDTLQ